MDSGGLELSNKLQQKRVAKECSEWIENKVEIKTIKQSNLLHGKMYHIATGGVQDAILGSSNFTVRGLGLGSGNNNIELDLIVDGNRDRQELKHWFDELWNNEDLVKDVKKEVLEYLKQLYENHPPEFIYYKTLFHIFELFLEDSGKTDADLGRTSLFETDIWKALFEFQKDGVKGAINKIIRYNGCIIADSVGLGKTFEALAVIKYFELKNERVMVLCPRNYGTTGQFTQRTTASTHFCRIDTVTTSFPYRSQPREGLFGRYRPRNPELGQLRSCCHRRVTQLPQQHPRQARRGRRDHQEEPLPTADGRHCEGRRPDQGAAISATPVNNDLKDLRNQIYFLTEGSENDGAFAENLGNRKRQGHLDCGPKSILYVGAETGLPTERPATS